MKDSSLIVSTNVHNGPPQDVNVRNAARAKLPPTPYNKRMRKKEAQAITVNPADDSQGERATT
jgi:hypothetical protein